ncbi:MAG: rhodanese-like domain-containing protein [Candidatus Kapabacteria bacterium]|jgi:rhodanese-related sulfurtransferase|nr:rhodanese-like domain-containing protein [Candidatus Kapabacteria bacterium]
MSKNLILVREIAILLGVSGILAISYNAFSPKPLPLIRTETTSVASDSLITALTTTSSDAASGQNTPAQAKELSAQTPIAAETAPAKPTNQASIQNNSLVQTQNNSQTDKKNTAQAIAQPTEAVPSKKAQAQATTPKTSEAATTQEAPKPAKALEIRTDQVEKLLANPDVLFIDARPANEYQLGHIGNAINIFTPEFEQNITRIIGLPREKPIVAYCGGGACELSHELAENLLKMGFQRVFVYVGGWNEWKQRKQ